MFSWAQTFGTWKRRVEISERSVRGTGILFGATMRDATTSVTSDLSDWLQSHTHTHTHTQTHKICKTVKQNWQTYPRRPIWNRNPTIGQPSLLDFPAQSFISGTCPGFNSILDLILSDLSLENMHDPIRSRNCTSKKLQKLTTYITKCISSRNSLPAGRGEL